MDAAGRPFVHNLSGSWRHTAAMFTTAIAAATRRSDMCGYIWPNGALLFFALLCAIKSYLSKNRRRGRRAGKTEVPGFPEWAPRAHPGKLETSVSPALLPVAEKGKGPGKWEGTGHLGVRGYCMATTRPLPVIRAVSSARMAPGVGCWASVCLVGPRWSSGPLLVVLQSG